MGNPWFREKHPRKKPWWASAAMWADMSGIFTVRFFGVEYEFPINKDTRVFMELIKGSRDPWAWFKGVRSEFRRAHTAERGIQDIVNALLIQVRETEVRAAANGLGQELKDRLEPLLLRTVRQRILPLGLTVATNPDEAKKALVLHGWKPAQGAAGESWADPLDVSKVLPLEEAFRTQIRRNWKLG